MQGKGAPGGETPTGELSGKGPHGLRGMHSAMGVALTLLDELLQMLPQRPDTAALKEINEVLREIRDLAGAGLRIVKQAAEEGR